MTTGVTRGKKPHTIPQHGLPISWPFADHAYTRRCVELMQSVNDGATPSQQALAAFFALRKQIWSDLAQLKKNQGPDYVPYLAERLGIAMDGDNRLAYPWKEKSYGRIGWESQFYTVSETSKRKLLPVELDFNQPCILLFTGGRTFSKVDGRAGHIDDQQILARIRLMMGMNCRAAQAGLAPQASEDVVQMAVFAYDLVDEEKERQAMRAQYALDPDFILPVSKRLAERVFGPRIAEAEFAPDGTFIRDSGRIRGKCHPNDKILSNLSSMVLVGACIGNLLCIQAIHYLQELMRELGVAEAVIQQAIGQLLLIGLLPSVPVIPPSALNYLAVSYRLDELSIALVDLESIHASKQAADSCLLPYCNALGNSNNDRHFQLMLDSRHHTIARNANGTFEFDFKESNFGHNIQDTYTDLYNRGFDKVIRRVLQTRDAFHLGRLIEQAIQNGELSLDI